MRWYLESLAAAYAEDGQFDIACAVQNESIAAARAADETSALAQYILELYMQGEPYREYPINKFELRLNVPAFQRASIIGEE